MKKFRNTLAFILCFMLVGCSKTEVPVTSTSPETEINTEQATIETEVTPEGEQETEGFQPVLQANTDLKIYILDVGQGSACLIKNNDDYMLIDAGENSCEDLIVQYLNDYGVTHLRYLIGTHPDSDHIGGLDAVIENFDIDTVFLSAIEDKDNKTCKDVLQALKDKGLTYSLPEIGIAYQLGGAYFFAMAPTRHHKDSNDNSIAIRVTYRNFDFVTTGDCEKEAEEDILKLTYNISADVYNAGHHGSSNASSEALLDRLNPSVVTISCGADNKYGHPHEETLRRFEDRNIRVYRTDELGTIEISSNGSIFSVNGAKEEEASEETENIISTEVAGEETEVSTEIEEVGEIQNSETVWDEFETLAGTQENYTVWISKTGTKYHREECDTLKNGGTAISLQEAIERGLEPCKKCRP